LSIAGFAGATSSLELSASVLFGIKSFLIACFGRSITTYCVAVTGSIWILEFCSELFVVAKIKLALEK
jgi:hypothetical protein